MTDLLEVIAAAEDTIVRQWTRAVRDLPQSPYQAVADDALQASIRRTAQALLHVMRTGNTAAMHTMLTDSARRRRAAGVGLADYVAVWLLYRQVLQQVLADRLDSEDAWDQLIDRVDAVLDWVVRTLNQAYRAVDA